MPINPIADLLETMVVATLADPGIHKEVSKKNIALAVAGARNMNNAMSVAIETLGVNLDNKITPEDAMAISDRIYHDYELYGEFAQGHGDDEGSDIETGYHYVQNNGSVLEFMGRDMIDTVIDGVYHIGYPYRGGYSGYFLNEDLAQNEDVTDIAGWLNYFLNGVHIRYGSSGNDMLGSGRYSAAVRSAANETFEVGAGNDSVYADVGNDTVYAGAGKDEVGGGKGHDQIYGEGGTDRLGGDEGKDTIWGGTGNDTIGGGKGNDKLYGEGGKDSIYGDEGNDTIDGGLGDDQINGGDGRNTLLGGEGNDTVYGGIKIDHIDGGTGNDILSGDRGADTIEGGIGSDQISGGDGADHLFGGEGNDELYGGAGADVIDGGAGQDKIEIWDNENKRDTVVFKPGDSALSTDTIDVVSGFQSGEDVIDLRALGPLDLVEIDYAGNDVGSLYYDGTNLNIDADGDRTTDMVIRFEYLDSLSKGDLLLA